MGQVLAGLIIVASLVHAAPTFTQKPVITKKGNGATITFAVNEATDVTVSILDKDGNTVCHLAAGMLGTNAPAPLKPGLEQSIEWDGKDDLGVVVFGQSGGGTAASRSAAGGAAGPPVTSPKPPFHVHIGLGTQPRFDRVIFYEPGISFAPRAVTVGPDKLLYVLMEHGQTKSTFLLQAFTKEGQYVRTVMPYPANLSDKQLEGLSRVKRPDGRMTPQMALANFRDLYPISTGMRPQTMPITSQGVIVLANSTRVHNGGSRDHRLLFVKTDGSIPEGLKYVGPFASSNKRHGYGLPFVAVSPDEKWIYTSGHRKGAGDDRLNPDAKGSHCVVYRIGWQDKELARPFIGELNKPGDDESHLNTPRGIAVDQQGRIYVCDRANKRVAVFDAEGKWVGKVDVEMPEQVAVDSKSSAIYVMTYKKTGHRKSAAKLIKFAGIGKPEVASVELGNSYPALGLDTQGEKPVIWLARTFFNTWESPLPLRGVQKVVDEGATLTKPFEIIKHRPLPDVCQIGASPVNDDVFVHSYSGHHFARVDGVSGDVKRFKIKGQDLAVGPEGEFYAVRGTSWKPGTKSIDRYDRDGQPLNFVGSDSNEIEKVPGNVYGHNGSSVKGISVSPRGDIAVIDKDPPRGMTIYGPDGKLKHKKIVDGFSRSEGSPIMDAAGNVYIATNFKPLDKLWPPFVEQTKNAPKTYHAMYGSVLKFSPKGGHIHRPPARPKKGEKPTRPWPPPEAGTMMRLGHRGRYWTKPGYGYIEGATWARYGFSMVPGGLACPCVTDRFTVDRYQRVLIPDVGRFEVLVVDANNNELFRFGDYGNEDSAGPSSKIPTPEIPLSWPYAVSVGKSGVYVSDFINRRIVKVKLTYTAEETAAVR